MPPTYGTPLDLGGEITRILAPNPSPMTQAGTNSFLLGTEELAVIDPGPESEAHLHALLHAIGGRRVTHVVVTHSHVDHSPLARRLADAVDAPVVAYGDSTAGRSEIMDMVLANGLIGGGEGVDTSFKPDMLIADGEVLGSSEWDLQAIHTPGHMGNHICLKTGDTIFSGDHVMGWASSLVSPPDGDLTDFMASCRKLLDFNVARHLSAHGDAVENPNERLNWLIAHRKSREAQIVQTLTQGPATPAEITQRIYTDIDQRLLPAALRNVFAHLIDLLGRNLVSAEPTAAITAVFRMI